MMQQLQQAPGGGEEGGREGGREGEGGGDEHGVCGASSSSLLLPDL